MRRTLLVIFIALLAVPVVASPCFACSCATSAETTPAERRRAQAKGSDLIFYGRADTVRLEDPAPNDGLSGDERIHVRFRVREKYKGYPGRWVTIHDGTTGDTCHFGFKEGERYTVFAYKHKGEFHTNICTATKKGRINPERYGLD